MEPVCNLYRIRTYLDEDDVTQGLAIGDVVSVDEDSDFPYCNIHTRGLRYPLRATQLEPLTQQEVNDLFEPQAPKKHEFTYGQRVTRQDGCIRCFVAYTSDGNIITNHDVEPKVATYLAPRSIIWSLEDSKQFIAYVKPPVHKELTMSELEEALGYKVKIVK